MREEKKRNEENIRKEREKADRFSGLLEEYKGEEEKLRQMMLKEQD